MITKKKTDANADGNRADIVLITGDTKSNPNLEEVAEHETDKARNEASGLLALSTSHLVIGVISGKGYSNCALTSRSDVMAVMSEMRFLLDQCEKAVSEMDGTLKGKK